MITSRPRPKLMTFPEPSRHLPCPSDFVHQAPALHRALLALPFALMGLSCKPRWDEAAELLEQRYPPRDVLCEVGAVEVTEGRYLDPVLGGCLGRLRSRQWIKTACTHPNSYNGCGRIELKYLSSSARVIGQRLYVPCGAASVIPGEVRRGFGSATVACRQVVKMDDLLVEEAHDCQLKRTEDNLVLGVEPVSWHWGSWHFSGEPRLDWVKPTAGIP
ncbi:MAG TPA: hypothetical protein VKP30_23945 [Polyangiaceae bacterium]|nr:hypothetical protein [Polyangiaceae bacterium]